MVKVPQVMELRGVVHALSEYKPQFADVDTVPLEDTGGDVGTVPLEDTGGDVVMAAKVVSAKANPIMTNATTAVVIGSFRFNATTAVVIGIGSFRFNATTAVVIGIGSFRFNATTAVVIESFRFAMITSPTHQYLV
jgi:hypothetical protein